MSSYAARLKLEGVVRIIKEAIKKFLYQNGFELVRAGEKLDAPFDLLGLVIRQSLEENKDFFFVQIGASDGVRSDNLYPLVVALHLKGLLVEPLPDQFDALKNNYAREPQLVFENAAIASTPGKASLFRFKASAPIPDWAHGMASFDKRHLTKFKDTQGLGDSVEDVSVPAITLKDLFSKHNVQQVSLLQLDTEGYDYEILKMAFKSDIQPEIINFEHQHLSSKDNLGCREMLITRGCNFVRYGRDILAVRSRTTP